MFRNRKTQKPLASENAEFTELIRTTFEMNEQTFDIFMDWLRDSERCEGNIDPSFYLDAAFMWKLRIHSRDTFFEKHTIRITRMTQGRSDREEALQADIDRILNQNQNQNP
jgi:hypothetical protein